MAFTLYKPIDFLHGVTLPTAEFTHTTALQVREGASAVTWNMLDDMNDYSGFSATAWGDINPAINSVDIDLEVSTNSGTDWSEHTGGAVADILPSDVTIGTANAVSAGTATVALASNSISADVPHNGTNRFRLKAVIDNA